MHIYKGQPLGILTLSYRGNLPEWLIKLTISSIICFTLKNKDILNLIRGDANKNLNHATFLHDPGYISEQTFYTPAGFICECVHNEIWCRHIWNLEDCSYFLIALWFTLACNQYTTPVCIGRIAVRYMNKAMSVCIPYRRGWVSWATILISKTFAHHDESLFSYITDHSRGTAYICYATKS